MKKMIISAAVIASFSLVSAAFAQSTVTGTLSSGGTAATTSSSTSLSGSVGSGNSLTGTVTSTSSSSGSGSTGSSGGGGGNGPIVGGGGGGGGPDTTVICPNLPNSLYTLPSGYEIVDGVCDPIGTVTTSPGIPNTGGTGTTPGIPNTGAGGNAEANDIVLIVSGLLGTAAGAALLRKQFVS